MALVGLEELHAARERIAGVAVRTPLVPAPWAADGERRLWLKPENLQPTGAFKTRGAYNRLAALSGDERARGVVAQSSGNHAQAVAYAADLLGIKAVIVMPDTSPAVKVEGTRSFGAEVVLVSPEERDTVPGELAERHGYVWVPPYDDPYIIAGQGTVGLEIAEDAPADLDTVLVPVSGGGLISGTAAALKLTRPGVRVIGVEPELAADAQASLRAGERVAWPVADTYRTIADGLRTPRSARCRSSTSPPTWTTSSPSPRTRSARRWRCWRGAAGWSPSRPARSPRPRTSTAPPRPADGAPPPW